MDTLGGMTGHLLILLEIVSGVVARLVVLATYMPDAGRPFTEQVASAARQRGTELVAGAIVTLSDVIIKIAVRPTVRVHAGTPEVFDRGMNRDSSGRTASHPGHAVAVGSK